MPRPTGPARDGTREDTRSDPQAERHLVIHELPPQIFEPQHLFEIFLIATGIYIFLRFLRSTRGSGLVRGLAILSFGILGSIVVLYNLLDLPVLEALVESVLQTLVLALVILFHPEIRRGVSLLGENPLVRRFAGLQSEKVISEIVRACSHLAKERRGAIIAFESDLSLDQYISGGVSLDSEVHHLIIESIFHPKSVLHDGGVIVRQNRIAAAACLFPLTEDPALSKRLGTRHRAAIGLSEETHALVIVVSEEQGAIGLVHRGKLQQNLTVSELEKALQRHLVAGIKDAE